MCAAHFRMLPFWYKSCIFIKEARFLHTNEIIKVFNMSHMAGENAIAGFSFAGLMFPGGEMPVRIFAGLIFACGRLPVKVCR